jgi:rsbT co-antagonist protein RsbR
VSRSHRLRIRLLDGVRGRRAKRRHSGTDTRRARQLGGLAVLLGILDRRRDDVLERATDWVIHGARDLGGKRPRDETRKLVDRVISTNVAFLAGGDRAPLFEFIEYVTSLRAASEFRISTILRGFLSFKRGLASVMAEEALGPRDSSAALGLVDEVYYEAIFQISDVYGEKLLATVEARRSELEVELADKRSELDEKISLIEAQRAMLAALSSPILSVWDGVVVLPLVGEISPERAEHARRKLLEAITAKKARVALLDVTGLSVADAHAASVLASMIHAVRLVGAEGMLVGVRSDVARVFVEIGEVFEGARTFATLEGGLRHAIRRASLAGR